MSVTPQDLKKCDAKIRNWVKNELDSDYEISSCDENDGSDKSGDENVEKIEPKNYRNTPNFDKIENVETKLVKEKSKIFYVYIENLMFILRRNFENLDF